MNIEETLKQIESLDKQINELLKQKNELKDAIRKDEEEELLKYANKYYFDKYNDWYIYISNEIVYRDCLKTTYFGHYLEDEDFSICNGYASSDVIVSDYTEITKEEFISKFDEYVNIKRNELLRVED